MRKTQIIILALVAAFAFSAVATSSASAVNIFLLNGAEITETIKVSITGEFLLEDMEATGTPDILCSVIWVGTISPKGKTGSVTEMLTLSGSNIENMVSCEDMKGTCEGGAEGVLVTSRELPWLLVADFSDPEAGEATKNPTLEVECKVLGIKIKDSCAGAIGGPPVNEVTGVLFELLENGAVPPLTCTLSGKASGLIVGNLFLTSPSGTVSVSS